MFECSSVSKLYSVQAPAPAKNSPSTPATPSSSGSTKIVCHRCKGMGYIMRDCPSRRAYIANEDGGHDSASDEENELHLQLTMMPINLLIALTMPLK